MPRNPKKYDGDYNSIYYRSGLELRAMIHLDTHSNVLSWHSEETVIPYISPVDNGWHRYYVDLKATVKKTDGSIVTYLIEVKPSSQCEPPKPRKKKSQVYLNEVMTYAVNQKKWEAAGKACEKMGWTFLLMTEKHLKNT